MKLKFKISKLALQDLDSIWLYTFENWSKTQANKYYTTIFKEIELICANPKIGKSIHIIKPNHRKLNIKSHLIIYKIKNEVINIDRILHKSMDIESLLKD